MKTVNEVLDNCYEGVFEVPEDAHFTCDEALKIVQQSKAFAYTVEQEKWVVFELPKPRRRKKREKKK